MANLVNALTQEIVGKNCELTSRVNKEVEQFRKFVVAYEKSSEICASIETSLSVKHEETLANYKQLVKGKDEEIRLLNEQIKALTRQTPITQNIQTQVGSSDEQRSLSHISNKTVSKVEKKAKRRYLLYEKRIKQLEGQMRVNEKKCEMEVLLQRSKLMIDLNSKHQKEVEKVATNLESKYRKYLNEFKLHASEQRHIDQATITLLKAEITDLTSKILPNMMK